MDTQETSIHAYYEQGEEQERLDAGVGELEFLRTTQMVLDRLPSPPAAVADIGGGPGRYTLWLAGIGYRVEHRDLMPLHVTQLREASRDVTGIHTAVGDARSLDLGDSSVDAVLLMGPLYHLSDRADRVRALREAARIVRPGGPVFAAAISRWAVREDGLLRMRLYEQYPELLQRIDEVEQAGQVPPLHEAGFAANTHRPEELRAELIDAGLREVAVASVEGPAFLLHDLPERLADPRDREVVLDAARVLGEVPELMGIGPHLLATGFR